MACAVWPTARGGPPPEFSRNRGDGQVDVDGARVMTLRIPRRQYVDLYGPTIGDRVRLADTQLVLEVEADFTTYGDESRSAAGRRSATGWVGARRRCARSGHHQQR